MIIASSPSSPVSGSAPPPFSTSSSNDRTPSGKAVGARVEIGSGGRLSPAQASLHKAMNLAWVRIARGRASSRIRATPPTLS